MPEYKVVPFSKTYLVGDGSKFGSQIPNDVALEIGSLFDDVFLMMS